MTNETKTPLRFAARGVLLISLAAGGCSATSGDDGFEGAQFASLEDVWREADSMVAAEEIADDEIRDEVATFDEEVLALLAEEGVDPEVAARDTIAARERAAFVELILADVDVSFRSGPRCRGQVADLLGGTGPDVIIAGSGNQVIHGRGGNDLLRGGPGRDLICGGNGADQIYGDTGRDTLLGQNGADFIVGGRQDDVIEGGDGNDTLLGTDRRGTTIPLVGQAVSYTGNFGPDANDTLHGNQGNDVLWFSPDDEYNGGSGNGDRCVLTTANVAVLAAGNGCEG